MPFSTITKSGNKERSALYLAGLLTGLITLGLGIYIVTELGLSQYAARLGIDDLDSLRPHYFDGAPFLPMFKYFIWPGILVVAGIRLMFTSMPKYISLIAFSLAIWQTADSLHTYYGYVNFYLPLILGCLLDLIAVILFALLLMRANSEPRPGNSP